MTHRFLLTSCRKRAKKEEPHKQGSSLVYFNLYYLGIS